MNGVTHGDVHPSRIQRFPNDFIKFNTIGLPGEFKQALTLTEKCKNINYLAPELVSENVVLSNKIDVWALGCTLYHLIFHEDLITG